MLYVSLYLFTCKKKDLTHISIVFMKNIFINGYASMIIRDDSFVDDEIVDDNFNWLLRIGC